MASPRREEPEGRNVSALSLGKPLQSINSQVTIEQNAAEKTTSIDAAARSLQTSIISSDAMKLITQRSKRTTDLANRSRQRVQTWLSTLGEPKQVLNCM